MRANFPEGSTLVSTTDLKGRIRHCNASFIEVSGFMREELLGQPHNLVRHPDMAEGGFRDLGVTVAGAQPWTGVVKNRCKNGDHYWVLANATPLVVDGRVTGLPLGAHRGQRRQCRGLASADEGPHDPDTLNTSTPIASRASKNDDEERMLMSDGYRTTHVQCRHGPDGQSRSVKQPQPVQIKKVHE